MAIIVQVLALLILGAIAGAAAWTGTVPDRYVVFAVVGIAVGARPETVVSVFTHRRR